MRNSPVVKRKGKEEDLYSAILVRTHTLKALRHGSHSFTCKLQYAFLSFVSVHHMALPLTEVADIELQLTTHLSTRRDERLSCQSVTIDRIYERSTSLRPKMESGHSV